MPAVLQFAYGPINPVAGFLLASVGILIGLSCTAQAGATSHATRRRRWLMLAGVAMGGGIWMMHFVALLGFDIPATPVRYDLAVTLVSAALSIVVISVGLFTVGYGRRSLLRTAIGGLVTGGGMAAMYYVGDAGIHIQGLLRYDTPTVAISVVLSVVTTSTMLTFAVVVRRWWPRVVAALLCAVGYTATHYAGMSALRVQLQADGASVAGINPIVLVLPITLAATAALLGLVFTALKAISEEEFAMVPDLAPIPAAITSIEPRPAALAAFTAQNANNLLPRSHRHP